MRVKCRAERILVMGGALYSRKGGSPELAIIYSDDLSGQERSRCCLLMERETGGSRFYGSHNLFYVTKKK